MGPELIAIPLAYYGSALVGAGLLVAIVVKRTRRAGLVIFALATVAAVLGALTVRPPWELITAGLNFTVVGLGLGVLVTLWKLSSFLWRKARGAREVPTHG